MKIVYSKFISGASASRFKVKGDKKSVKNWRNNVIEQTKDGIGIINKECRMKVIFKFHSSRYPTDFPYGPDLDNHIKNLWDGLNETIFKNAPGPLRFFVRTVRKPCQLPPIKHYRALSP